MRTSAAPPIALFVVGGVVAQFSISPYWRRTAAISAGKLLLHPILEFAVLSFVPGPDASFLLAGVLFAAAPMLSIHPILGARFDAEQVCATVPIVSTAVSFATVISLIWILTAGAS